MPKCFILAHATMERYHAAEIKNNLKKIFLTLSESLEETQKSFNEFKFTNKEIKKIDTNTFYDIGSIAYEVITVVIFTIIN